MARAVLRQQQYATASRHRLRDATKLLEAQRWTGSIYLGGFAVECLAKAEVTRELVRIGGLIANREGPLYEVLWSHDLVAIAEVLAYPPSLMRGMRRVSERWEVALRYSSNHHERRTVEDFIGNVSDVCSQIQHRLVS